MEFRIDGDMRIKKKSRIQNIFLKTSIGTRRLESKKYDNMPD
jgi:hypothetical protein